MKITVIGRGKTGGALLHLVPRDSLVGVFDRTTPPNNDLINSSDACIVFVPGPAFLQLLPQLVACTTPLVIGATGFTWPEAILRRLEREQKRWVHGHNFSLAMNLVRNLLGVVHSARELLQEMHFHLHEVHHSKKQDAPSGTALKWQEWLGLPQLKISSERTGDEIGLHQLTIQGPMEQIQLQHRSLDRKVFAHGALWAAQKLLHTEQTDPTGLPYGVIPFEHLVDRCLKP